MEIIHNHLPLLCTLVGGGAGILYPVALAGRVRRAPDGNQRMREIAAAISGGGIVYLNRQLKTAGITGGVIAVVIAFTLGITAAIGFVLGAVALYLVVVGQAVWSPASFWVVSRSGCPDDVLPKKLFQKFLCLP